MAKSGRVGTASNLSEDGTYDILLFTYESGFPNGRLRFSYGPVPRKITGVQKVAQALAKILITPKGSDPIRPSLGTEFPSMAMGSALGYNRSQSLGMLTSAVKDAEAQVKNYLSGGKDYDSQLQTASVLNFDLTEDMITLYIQIITRAGKKASVAIPFPQTDLALNA